MNKCTGPCKKKKRERLQSSVTATHNWFPHGRKEFYHWTTNANSAHLHWCVWAESVIETLRHYRHFFHYLADEPTTAPPSLCWLNFKFIDSSDHTIPLPSDLCCRISVPFVPVHLIMTVKSCDTMCLQSETVWNRSTLSSVNLPLTFQVSVLAGLNVIIVFTSANEVMWQPTFVSVHLPEKINSWMNKFQWNSSENVGVSQSRSRLPLGEVPEGFLIFQK